MSSRKALLVLIAAFAIGAALPAHAITCQPGQTVVASIAAIDQPFMLNRYGAAMPQGMIFVRKRAGGAARGGRVGAGNAMLRPNKRPRPIVLRVRQGDCLQITLTNLLGAPDPNNGTLQPATPGVPFHV